MFNSVAVEFLGSYKYLGTVYLGLHADMGVMEVLALTLDLTVSVQTLFVTFSQF